MQKTDARVEPGLLNLSPLTEPLGFERAKHLLNRCMFGAKFLEIESFKNYTPSEAIDALLQDRGEELSPPITVKDSEEEVAIGETWVNTKYSAKYRGERMYSYSNWWIGRLIHQDVTLHEKMTLFWHNHFVIESNVVRNSNFNYRYNMLISNNALGNFKNLVEAMTVNVGMLTYLDGVKNEAGAPNENYARELFELFTIGKGPLVEEGNYTNYTEHDIREAARVLTGWKTNANTDSSYFSSAKHDQGIKTFSSVYDQEIISNNGEDEYKDLINMIFGKRETACYLVRKLYRWFVYHEINEEIETNIIQPLADSFIQNEFELKPLLKTLLTSQHFYNETYRGAMIKDSLMFSIGILRQLEYPTPDNSDIEAQYGFWNTARIKAGKQDLYIGNPPDVAGWPAWYLAPGYNRLWINTATIPNRANTVKAAILWGTVPLRGYDKIFYDPFVLAYRAADPSDIDDLLGTFTKLLFPAPPTEQQLAELKNILIPGLPDYEWTIEWNRYINNPADVNQKNAVANSLKSVLAQICSMAEYQLT